MEKIFKTLYNNMHIFFESYFWIPFSISLTLIFITFVFQTKKIYEYKKIGTVKTVLQSLILFICFFFISELFYVTLFSRIGTYTYPLADIFGEWSIYDGESSMYVNPRPILNIILFLPVCFVFSQLLKTFFNTDILKKLPVLKCTGISLGLSLIIELGQLLFALGTFQLSDLFYNTLGGLIGALIYCAAVKIVNKKRC